MAIGGFFKLPKHKQFDFKPRYYNADKEEFDERVRQSEIDSTGKSDRKYVPNIKGKMRRHLIDQKMSPSPYSKIRKMVIGISVFMLFIVFYYLIDFYGILIDSN